MKKGTVDSPAIYTPYTALPECHNLNVVRKYRDTSFIYLDLLSLLLLWCHLVPMLVTFLPKKKKTEEIRINFHTLR